MCVQAERERLKALRMVQPLEEQLNRLKMQLAMEQERSSALEEKHRAELMEWKAQQSTLETSEREAKDIREEAVERKRSRCPSSSANL